MISGLFAFVRTLSFGYFIWIYSLSALAQSAKPGLEGMAPSKWITLKHSQNMGLLVNCHGERLKTNQEDIFFKIWLPVVHKPSFNLLVGPQYRTEQMEFEDVTVNEAVVNRMSHWNLRFWGVDVRSMIKRSDNAWYAFDFMVNQSGTFHDQSASSVPFNYTFSAVTLRRKSNKKEIGYGFMVNWSLHRITPLPVFIFNYNFSPKSGVEIGLPRKLAFRYSATKNDRFYFKTEASSRNYFVTGNDINAYDFRRTDLNVGIAYNKQLTKMIGFEIFGGYRKNIAHQLPPDVKLERASGPAFSVELHLLPPSK